MKKCITCKHGELKPSTTAFMADRDGVLVVIRSVPALICSTCEEEYFDEAVTEELLQEVEESVKAHGQVVIREYEAA
jgi:YgiT-type zinc finger domain-containing protein